MINPNSVFADFFKDKTPLRAKAELLMDRLQEGNICIELTSEEANQLILSQHVGTGLEKKPFILSENHLYLQRYYFYESLILERIHSLSSVDVQSSKFKVQRALIEIQGFIDTLFDTSTETTNWQLVAAINACMHQFAIITGGPGTGKTTTVAKVISMLFKMQSTLSTVEDLGNSTSTPTFKVALAAPTGKAAMRMKESIADSALKLPIDAALKEQLQNIVPLTIHRLLGYKKDSPYFRHNAENKLLFDLIIIDEASMIDVPMMAKLLDAIPDTCKIIFLGDKNQLASVEAGSVFSDLCSTISKTNTFSKENSSFINQFIKQTSAQLNTENISADNHFLANAVVELEQSWRFNPKEGIGYFSRSVIEGKVLQIDEWNHLPTETRKGIAFYERLENAKEDILRYATYINEPNIKTALQASSLVRVLCAVKEGNNGMHKCNAYIETVLKEARLIEPKQGFYENQLIMITANNYNLGIFNGDVGIVRKDEASNLLFAYFEDANSENGIKSIATTYIKNFDTAFAMTIHKSQGSEFETAIVVMPENKANLLTRELLYTGVTRAKKEAKIIISQTILEHTTFQRVQRCSGILVRSSSFSSKFNV